MGTAYRPLPILLLTTWVADIVASHEKRNDCNIAYHIEYPNDILKDFLAGSVPTIIGASHRSIRGERVVSW